MYDDMFLYYLKRDIGRTLKQFRLNHKLTQTEAAERFGVTKNSISNIETGSNFPSLLLFFDICEFYNIDPHYTFDICRRFALQEFNEFVCGEEALNC